MENPTVESTKEYYNANLKAHEYNKTFNTAVHSSPMHFEFMLKFIYDVIQSEKFQGSKLLEIGSGATVYNIASASYKFSHIVQSDYVIDNCNELKKWHSGTSSLDWSQFLDIVLKLEGKGETLKELESRIRSSVKAVVRGDLLSDNVLSEDELTAECSPPYDMVISVLCLQAAAPDFDGYIDILKRINNLLRKGGALVICDYDCGSPWAIGDKTFHYVKLTLQQILDAFKIAGFKICESKTKPKLEDESFYDYKNLFCIAAEKL